MGLFLLNENIWFMSIFVPPCNTHFVIWNIRCVYRHLCVCYHSAQCHERSIFKKVIFSQYEFGGLHCGGCSHCTFLGCDSIVLSVDNTFSEKHITSIFKVEVCRVRNDFGCTGGCKNGGSSYPWEGERWQRVIGQFNSPPVWRGLVYCDLFSCSPFLLTRPGYIASPTLVSLNDHPPYINQSILHSVFLQPWWGKQLVSLECWYPPTWHDHMVSQPRRPQPEHIFIPSTLL